MIPRSKGFGFYFLSLYFIEKLPFIRSIFVIFRLAYNTHVEARPNIAQERPNAAKISKSQAAMAHYDRGLTPELLMW